MNTKNLFAVMMVLAFTTIGCKDNYAISIEDVSAQYIRTNGYVEGRKYPITTIISSKSDLEQYCELYQDTYDLTIFRDAINVYTNDFFVGNFLAVVILQEGSGSIGHKVERIETNGDIIICRLIPSIQTADMAVWNIIIELDNIFRVGRFRVKFIDKALY